MQLPSVADAYKIADTDLVWYLREAMLLLSCHVCTSTRRDRRHESVGDREPLSAESPRSDVHSVGRECPHLGSSQDASVSYPAEPVSY